MSTLSTNNPTLADVAKTLDPNGSIAKILEVLNQRNDILDDLSWTEGNLPTGHRTTIRTGLPEPSFRKLYGGVAARQVRDCTGYRKHRHAGSLRRN